MASRWSAFGRVRAALAVSLLAASFAVPTALGQGSDERAETPEQRRTHAITACEQSVATQVENPGFVNWPARSQYKVRERSGEYDIEGYVDTPAPTGDVRTNWTCHATARGGEWSARASMAEAQPAKALRAEDRAPVVRPDAAMPEPRKVEPAPRQPPPSAELPPPRPLGEAGTCPSVTFRDVSADKFAAQGYQIVKGTIENTGRLPIWNVKVCASGTCETVHGELPPMAPGAKKSFSFKVPTLAVVTVTAACAVVGLE